MVDVCVVAGTLGVLTAAVLAAVPRWTGSAEQIAGTAALELVLRDAQQRALSEGRPLCVDAVTWAVEPGECGAGNNGATFFADGSATPTTFRVGTDIVTLDASGETG